MVSLFLHVKNNEIVSDPMGPNLFNLYLYTGLEYLWKFSVIM
ncbi:hypothetical protein MUK42_31728 [Musa troglodytarum]|uniref:Uncharacterized protein n=1 Tax=Musa troglodytarum TaxID=320322 RepID=A0A9E7L9P9_9LILI|nr:hypothetical protein MUK42_31728 [Musa troglodytarum]